MVSESSINGNLEVLDKVFDVLIEKCGFLVSRLKDFVEFPTVSSDPSRRPNIQEMAEYLVGISRKFGMRATILPMTLEEDLTKEPPSPLVLAETKSDPSKRTVCFYCHFDVRPLTAQDYWYSDPFVLTSSSDGAMVYGKGTSAGKGPLLCLFNAIGAYQQLGIDLPINVKLVMDPLGLADDELTGKFLRKTSLEFFSNVDFVCLCVGQWFGDNKPCVSHGSRGLCYFSVQIEGPSKDLNSGSYGGLLNEPMTDLVYMMDQLVDKRGIIKINDIYEDVVPITKEDADYYKSIDFVVRDFKSKLGARELLVNEDKKSLLTNLWRMPSLTIHGIEGAFSGPHTRNVIPSKVTGKFSINIVPNMTPSGVKKRVFAYLNKMWKARKSTNKIKVQMTVGKLAWFTDPKDVNCIAAVNAIRRVYNEEPELVRDSKRVRMANVLRRVTNASVIAIPVGKDNDVSDANAEKIDLTNYINGCKIFATYFLEISALSPVIVQQEKPPCSCKTTGEIIDCNCYLKAGLVVEEEEQNGEEETSSLTDSIYIASSGVISSSTSAGRVAASARYYSYSSRVMKQIEKLQRIIFQGESIIGPRRRADAEDEEAGEDGSDGNQRDGQGTDKTPEAMKQCAATVEKGLPETSGHSVDSDIGNSVELSKEQLSIAGERSYLGKSKSQGLTSLAGASASAFVSSETTKQSPQSGTHKLAVSRSGPICLTLEETDPAKAGDGSGVIKSGYLGKRPFNLSDNSSRLSHEPFSIISSLSALLYKRRAQKLESASVKSLAGSRIIASSGLPSNGSSSMRLNSTALHGSANSTSKTLENVDRNGQSSSKVSHIYVSIDQPRASSVERRRSSRTVARVQSSNQQLSKTK